MKNKILKISMIILLIMTLTLTNFIFVGSSLISYAASAVETNNKNIEFDAYFVNGDNQSISSVDMANQEDIYLYMQIQVKQEGYFNGKVTIEDSNFSLKDTDSSYVNKIEGNTITFNQINANTLVDAKVKIELNKDEIFNLDNLNKTNVIKLDGTYYDSSERDKTIEATREVKLSLTENYTAENISNDIEVITNKVMSVDGQEKRVVQVSWKLGLKDNNYPIKEIETKLAVPSINGEMPEISRVVTLNTMTNYDYSLDGSTVNMKFTNEVNNNEIKWKTDGNEKVILTFIYDNDANVDGQRFTTEQKVRLYDNKEITASKELTLNGEEKDSIVTISSYPEEASMYKGRLYAGLEKEYVTNTSVDINLAKAINSVEITENANQNLLKEVYTKSVISKETFDKLFGETGEIIVYNQNNEEIGRITASSQIDDDGNIVITYSGDPASIRFETSKPVTEGTLNIKNYKKLVPETSNIAEISQIGYISKVGYNKQDLGQVENNITLEETTTQSKFEINKNTLSTVVDNSVEMRATLLSNNEKYDLYQNPVITFELPEQVQSAEITSVELLYEGELKVANYNVEGRNIVVTLEGKQTNYKDMAIEGAELVVNANLKLNRNSATLDSKITMYYQNEIAHSYQDEGRQEQGIKIIAPQDMAVINSIPEISLETTGQEEKTNVNLLNTQVPNQLNVNAEVINTNENNMKDVKILGTFPTDSKTNNLGTKILSGMQVSKEDVKTYYTENEDATNDVNDNANGWSTEFTQDAKKYLVVADSLATGESIEFSYPIENPENLEYNKQAKESYNVSYTNEQTAVEGNIDSTEITLETGVGPKVDAKLSATSVGNEITQNVKNGEVIRYNIEVSNTGSQNITGIEVTAQVPEGTTMVVPEENYEYTGASYYEELEDREFKTTIDSLEVGEVKTVSYEVRVDSDTKEGTRLENKAQIKYGEATIETDTNTLTTETGNLRVTVKRVTDRKVDLYESGAVQYFAIIENISNSNIEDVKINTNISNNLDVSRLNLITGMGKEDGDIYNTDSDVVATETEVPGIAEASNNIQTEEIEYQDEISIGSLDAGQSKVLSYDMIIKDSNADSIQFSVSANDGQKEYNSNEWQDRVESFDIGLSMETQTESQYVKAGDSIQYTINIKNSSTSRTSGLVVKDNIPSQLNIESILLNGAPVEGITTNNLEIPVQIEANQDSTIVINTVVNYSAGRTTAEAITNVAYAEVYGERVATSAEINHIIQANDGSFNGNNDVDDNDIAKGNMTITGVAWFDEDANGSKDEGEQLLSGIKVRLLNAETNNFVKTTDGNVLEATTNENGVYVLDKIANGRYIAVFDYDNTKYTLTKYKAAGIADNNNSSVLMNTLNIENTDQEVASTDILEVNNGNISNINIGLALLQNYDLKLDKYVSKIILQNSSGTTVREYQDETMAKAEIDAKRVNGTTAIIEFQIKVTNVGDVTGYARRIVDYIPSDLTFNSEMNKDWYQAENGIYTSVLSNEPIAPGETKTVTLTLVKSMTEDNTGRINNRAEIAEDYNDLGLKDVNSTPGNQESGENDLGSADVILSIRTGGAIVISAIVVIIIALIGIGIVIYRKKAKKGDI